jgi:hypothetical protein
VQRRLAAILTGNVAGYSRLMGADEASRVLAMEPHFHCRVSLIQVAGGTPEVSGPILAALKEPGLPE